MFGGAKEDEAKGLPYRLRDDFVSRAEVSFYGVLRLAVGDHLVICPKVNLGDIFYVAAKKQAQAYRNKINTKHVDFLLCNPQTLRPEMGIELDDSTHQRSDRQQRDAMVESVFEAAGLPIVRVPARASDSVEEVKSLLREGAKLRRQGPQPAAEQGSLSGSQKGGPPTCPKCSVPNSATEQR